MEGRALAGIVAESGWGATEMASVYVGAAPGTDGVQELLTLTMTQVLL